MTVLHRPAYCFKKTSSNNIKACR